MKSWRLLALLLVLGAATFWFLRTRDADPAQSAQTDDAPQAAYDYQANDVVLRQMGPDGRMAFQIEAKAITQLPANGRIMAQGLTLYHDPPGTEPGGPHRWTLTADNGELPAEGGTITLAGKVRAHGIPVNGSIPLTFASEHLQYDMTTQELSSDDEVLLTSGDNILRGRGLRANIRTSDVELGPEVHATLVPR